MIRMRRKKIYKARQIILDSFKKTVLKMLSKKILIALFLIAILSVAQAQAYQIARHEITIKVQTDGTAHVSEKFFLTFPNNTALNQFKAKSLELGVSLESWKAFNPAIHVYIAGEKNIRGGQVAFVEEAENYLGIEYDTTVPIMGKSSETSRQIFFELNKQYFQEFNQTPFWIIPNNTVITINLPAQATIDPGVKPDAIISDTEKKVVWVGYQQSNVLMLKYALEKQIAPSFDISQLLQGIINSEFFIIGAILLALVAIVAYLKRKAITEKIEDYISKNSEFEKDEEEEEENESEQ